MTYTVMRRNPVSGSDQLVSRWTYELIAKEMAHMINTSYQVTDYYVIRSTPLASTPIFDRETYDEERATWILSTD